MSVRRLLGGRPGGVDGGAAGLGDLGGVHRDGSHAPATWVVQAHGFVGCERIAGIEALTRALAAERLAR